MAKSNQKYVLDYEQKCHNCGQTPVVTIEEAGEVIHNFEMCGPCAFGSAKCIDPDEWKKNVI